MVTTRKFIIASFGLFLMTRCGTKVDKPIVAPSVVIVKAANQFIGEWKYENTIWYSSELTLHNDGTFTYHDQSCSVQRFSQGKWKSENSSISLTSFDNFQQIAVIENTKTVEATEHQKPEHKREKRDVEFSFVGFKEKTTTTFPNAGDTVRVYLDNIQLQLINDSLYCLSSNKLLEQAKFYKTKNNR